MQYIAINNCKSSYFSLPASDNIAVITIHNQKLRVMPYAKRKHGKQRPRPQANTQITIIIIMQSQ